MKGRFITFEGGEGAGKSTQIKLLAERLRGQGRDVRVTREPGGSPGAEAIRDLLVNGEPSRWTAECETLLNYAARASHLEAMIRPALVRGEMVLCDRFMDSTRVYQGIAGGVSPELIDALERSVVGAERPDLTLVFDLDAEVGLERARQRGGADRFERRGLSYHTAIRAGFLKIAADDPARCRLIDASMAETAVAEAVWREVAQWL